jgi:hypothetical protein
MAMNATINDILHQAELKACQFQTQSALRGAQVHAELLSSLAESSVEDAGQKLLNNVRVALFNMPLESASDLFLEEAKRSLNDVATEARAAYLQNLSLFATHGAVFAGDVKSSPEFAS